EKLGEIYRLVQVFVCIFEVYLMFDFFSTFFPLKEALSEKYTRVLIVLGSSACVFVVNALNNSVINIVAMQVIYLLILFCAFRGGFVKRIVYYVMATAIMAGSEFIAIVLLSLPSDFSMSEIQKNPISTIYSLLCAKLLSFIFFNVVKRIPKNTSNKMDLKNLMLYIVVPVSMMGIMIAIAYLNIDFASMGIEKVLLIFSSILAIVGSVLTFYVFDRYSSTTEKLRQQELMIARLEMEERYYEQVEEMNQEHASLLHDFHHYLKTIGEAAAENNDRDVMSIIAELKIQIADTESIILCGHRLLNAILNEKKKEAEQKGIAIHITVEPEFTVEQMKDIDLIAITGNLIDNAMEASSECKDGYVKIYMYTQNEGRFSVMKIVNNYKEEIQRAGEIFLTSKEDKERHGIGIQNVKQIVARYGGFFQNIYENGIFTSLVVLPVGE
ncbi:MAG: GHKL domain-containing protein, partial [Lachnospiraceae bacterium]|nr:GHKL domain-containing protein [Lachnospiraceae bacterium]